MATIRSLPYCLRLHVDCYQFQSFAHSHPLLKLEMEEGRTAHTVCSQGVEKTFQFALEIERQHKWRGDRINERKENSLEWGFGEGGGEIEDDTIWDSMFRRMFHHFKLNRRKTSTSDTNGWTRVAQFSPFLSALGREREKRFFCTLWTSPSFISHYKTDSISGLQQQQQRLYGWGELSCNDWKLSLYIMVVECGLGERRWKWAAEEEREKEVENLCSMEQFLKFISLFYSVNEEFSCLLNERVYVIVMLDNIWWENEWESLCLYDDKKVFIMEI